MADLMKPTDIEELLSHDLQVRMEAARKFGVPGSEFLDPEEYYVEVADRLASLGGSETLPTLHRLLGHPEPLVRAAAACALAKIHPDTGASILETLLSENDRDVRRRVMEALCSIRPPGAGRVLARTLWTMYQSRHRIDPADDWTRDLRRRMTHTLGMIGEAYAVNCLGQAIHDGDPQVRANAARAMGMIGDASALPELVEALDDQDHTVRLEAAEALRDIGDHRRASGPLLRALDDPHPTVAAAAARSLGLIRETRAIPELLRIIAGESDRVSRAAFRALRMVGFQVDVAALTDELLSSEANVERRCTVAALLGLSGDLDALPPLLTALGGGSVSIKTAAARALGRLGDRRATGYLCDIVEENQPAVVLRAVALALGDLGDPTADWALKKILGSDDQVLAHIAHSALVRVGQAQFDPDLWTISPLSNRTRAPQLLRRADRFDERL